MNTHIRNTGMKILIAVIMVLMYGNPGRAVSYILPDSVDAVMNLVSVDTLYVDGDVRIESGAQLIIYPGTRVEFRGYYFWDVKGTVTAHGKESEPVLFTAADTVEGWHGIRYINAGSSTNSTSEFIHCIFEHSRAIIKEPHHAPKMHHYNGGAIWIHEFSDVIIDSCVFRKNKAYLTGGGISLSKANVDIKNCVFIKNYAKSTGGALDLGNGSNQIVQNNQFIHNNSGSGGAIFSSNTNPGYPKIINNIIEHNSGGGLNFQTSHPYIEGNTIRYNTNSDEGGGIYLDGKGTLINNTITHNYSKLDGGGLYIFESANHTLTGNLIAHNVSDSKGGGVFMDNYYNKSYFINNTIVNNQAVTAGGILFSACNIDMHNSIIYGNKAPNNMANEWSLEITIFHCIVQGDTSGFSGDYTCTYTHNTDTTPGFAIPGQSYRLAPGSPCINAGTPDTTGLELPAKDLLGNARISNDTIDIGAYEFHAPAATPARANSLADITLEEDFGADTLFSTDTAFSYYLGNEWLAYGLEQPIDTTILSAHMLHDTLLLFSKPDKHGKDTLIIYATDGMGGTATDTLIITVLPVNDPPVTDSVSYTWMIPEHSSGIVIDTIHATDIDTGQALSFYMPDADSGLFGIEEHTGIVYLTDSATLDYETVNLYTRQLIVSDNGQPAMHDTAVIYIHITDVNEPPAFSTAADTITIAENPAPDTLIYTVSATDPDNEQSLRYTMLEGVTDSALSFHAREVRIADTAVFDYERMTSAHCRFEVTDGALRDTMELYIYITDVDETDTNSGPGERILYLQPSPLSLHPNPCHNFLEITIPGNAQQATATLYTMDGRQALQTHISGNPARLDVSRIAPGHYVVHVAVKEEGRKQRVWRSVVEKQ